MAGLATQVMLGARIADLGLTRREIPYVGIKEAVFPFNMFPEVDPLLGPEMRSTGEVLGLGSTAGLAFFRAEEAANAALPTSGAVLLTFAERDRGGEDPATPGGQIVHAGRTFGQAGMIIRGTRCTSQFLWWYGTQARPNL